MGERCESCLNHFDSGDEGTVCLCADCNSTDDVAVLRASLATTERELAEARAEVADLTQRLDYASTRFPQSVPQSVRDYLAGVARGEPDAVQNMMPFWAKVRPEDLAALLRERETAHAALDSADTTRREWEVRAAESYAKGRAAGLREAAEVCDLVGDSMPERTYSTTVSDTCRDAILALAPPAAETTATWRCDDCGHDHQGARMAGICVGCACPRTKPAAEAVRSEALFNCRTCDASTPGWTDGRFASPGWGRIDHIDGPNAICPVCAADPTSLDCLRDEYPDVAIAAEPRDEGES